MIWWLALEKKPFQFWREIWIQVVVMLLQLYRWFFFRSMYFVINQPKIWWLIFVRFTKIYTNSSEIQNSDKDNLHWFLEIVENFELTWEILFLSKEIVLPLLCLMNKSIVVDSMIGLVSIRSYVSKRPVKSWFDCFTFES